MRQEAKYMCDICGKPVEGFAYSGKLTYKIWHFALRRHYYDICGICSDKINDLIKSLKENQ